MEAGELQGIVYYLLGLMAAGLVAEFLRAFIWVGLAFLFFGRFLLPRVR